MTKNRYVKRGIVITLIATLMLSMMPMSVSAASKNPGKTRITSMKAGKVSKKTNKATVTVKWKKAKKASGYEIYEKHAADDTWRKLKTVGKHKRTVKIKKVPAGRYYVKVRAIKKSKGKKYYGKFSSTKSVYIKSKWSVARSMYSRNGQTEIDRLNAELQQDGASIFFDGNRMVVTYHLEKILGFTLNDAEIQALKAELMNDQDFKNMSVWLKNASGVKSAILVVEVRNNGNLLFSINF